MVLILLALSSTVISTPLRAQSGDDEFGNWLIYNGTVRIADHWSVFTEAQLRLFEFASNFNEAFVRAAGHYHFNDRANVGLGYLRAETRPFNDAEDDLLSTTEDRLYLHFALTHPVGKAGFEHRYRLEQRWLEQSGSTETSNRLRYRLQVTTPINRPTMEPGAWFVNVFDELFINFDSMRTFDQNRLYVAGGYQFTPLANLQLGLLWQARTEEDFFRFQIFYTHNFDLRKN